MVRGLLTGVLGTLMIASAGVAADVEVPLTVTERAGVARVGNHVNSGVPLPVGAVKDVGELGLYTADGTPVNAQITERCRWLKDNSLKFVTVHFACDLPAKGTMKYVLKSQPADFVAPIKTTATADAVTVDTGVLKFVVKKTNYTLFDQVWLGEAEVVAPGTAKVTLVATEGDYKVAAKIATVNQEGEPFETMAVAKTIELEENGPVRAVVKVTGSFMKGDGKTLDFVARYHALAGSPNVRVTFTVVNRVGKAFASFIGMQELSLTVPLKGVGGDLQYAFAGAKKDVAGNVSGNEKATLLQLKSTEYTVNGKAHKGGRDEKSRRLGWVSLTNGKTGLAAGVRSFWQLYPKGLEVSGNGTVKVMLVAPSESASRAGAKGVPMFTGGARTHEVLFAFGGDGAAAMGVVDPLFAQAPTDWYCQKTWGFGQLYDANLENFKPEYRDLVKKFQSTLEGSYRTVIGRKDGTSNRGMEEYGFFNWGCGVHHSTEVKGTWLDTGWNGNYYDFPFSLMVNFVRTGNPDCWDYAQAHALHIADVDVCHWHPTNQRVNGIEHVCYSIGHFRQFWRSEPFGISGNADSTKNQSLYHCYYMTGDRWYLDVALLVSNYNATAGGGSLRARGNRMTGTFGSYEATHDPTHLERWTNYVKKAGINLAKSRGIRRWDQDWMYGLAAEGLMTYYRTTGDLAGAEAVRTCCDSLINTFWNEQKKSTKTLPGFSLICFGYAYELTGDEAYLTKGLGQLAAVGGGSRTKSFAQQFRLSPQFLYYLAKDYEPPKPALTEKRVFEPPKPKPPTPPKPRVTADKAEFPAVRDIRIMTHASEAEQNAGGGTRLRVRNANSRSGEVTILDFDTAAMKAYLDANKGKPVTATLVLKVLELRNVPATLRVAPLRSTVDWNEGTQVQQKANRGEACYAWAQFGTTRWTDAQGKEVPDVRATFYDRTAKKLLGIENSTSVVIEKGMREVQVPLDEALVKDLAENKNNRGLILFTAQSVDGPQAIVDFRSRETRAGAVLRLEVKEVAPRLPVKKPVGPLGNEVTLKPVKDARITCHPSEARFNSGGATRLRARGIQTGAAELIIMDFDRAVIGAFLEQKAGMKIEAKLVLQVREVQNGPGKLEMAALDSAVDWGEGKGVQEPAQKGDCAFLAAQTGVKPWTTAAGKEVANLRDLFYDASTRKVTTLLNGHSADVAAGMKTVSLVLDGTFLKHLATDKNARGVVLFTRHPSAKLDVYGRAQSRREARLVLTAQR